MVTKAGKFEMLLVFVLLSATLFSVMVSTPFHSDEDQWIGTSYYFDLLLKTDFQNENWNVNYWTLTQPPLTRYMIGIGTLLANIPVDTINPPSYDTMKSYDLNLREGRVHRPAVLFAARAPMVTAAVFAVMFLYLLFRERVSLLAGTAFLALFLSNAYLRMHLTRALSEALLTGLFLLIGIATFQAQKSLGLFLYTPRSIQLRRKTYLWFVLIGVAVGFAASCKINAFGILAVYPFLCLLWLYGSPNQLLKKEKTVYLIRFFFTILFSALLVFVLLNPFLYPNPIVNMGLMLKWRFQEMAEQSLMFSHELIPGNLVQRWGYILKNILTEYASLRFTGGFWVNLVLGVSGMIWFIKTLLADWKRQHALSQLSLLILLALPIMAGAMMSPFDWPRYFLFPVLIFLFLVTLGIHQWASWVGRLVKKSGLADK